VRGVVVGYRWWWFTPRVGSEFGWLVGGVECPYGRIEVRFEGRGERGGWVRVRVPVGTVGTVVLPVGVGEGVVMEVRREGWEVGRKRSVEGGRVDLGHGTWEVDIVL
jgi:hypothetical protein